jgi:hypothetical protein
MMTTIKKLKRTSTHIRGVIKSIKENKNETLNVMDNKTTNEIKSQHLAKKPLFWGITAGITLLSVYFLILSIAESFSHSIEQFKQMWYWIAVLVLGFSIQAGLFAYIRGVMKLRKDSGATTSSMAAAGGISTTSMVACCAHHITDVLPILGVSAAALFLNQFQDLFLTVGVLSNLIGISLILKIIQKHGLYQRGQRVFSVLMKLDMNRSFYAVSALSAVTLLATLYMSI